MIHHFQHSEELVEDNKMRHQARRNSIKSNVDELREQVENIRSFL